MTTVLLCIQHWLGKAPSSFQDSVTARSTSLDKSKKRSSTCEEFRGVFETFPLLHQTRRCVFWLRTCRSPYTQAQRCRIAHAIGEVLDALDGLGVLWLGGPSSLSLYLQVTLSVSISFAGGDYLGLMNDKLLFKTVNDVSFLNRIPNGVFMINLGLNVM